MKIFIYKLLISIIAIYALFEITIGARLDHFTDITNSIKNVDQRTLMKEKIKNEMKKAIEKENYFTEEERYLISNFIKKIQNELSLDKDN
tara:strand:- start:2400 stop:2669 length:270 start_codon:yes stop_codon:yes gene_type:complete